jgi:asparagine synthase (glutamine-hydrolysing)
MCGIAGIVSRERRVDRDALQRMGASIRHRGPDDAGLWVEHAPGVSVGLAHQRLSIIDLSSAGHQPMTNEDQTVWVTYNGEIYNHRDLRAELEAAGHRYHSLTDSETILHAYEAWGDRFMERFRGMFAFGLWDSPRRRLVLVRDRLGVKPLYYAQVGDGTLVFASEIKAILASGLVRPEPERSVLPEYLQFGYLSGHKTMFRHIRALPPGHVLTWEDSGIHVRPYWELQFQPDTAASERDQRERFTELFDTAVRMRLMSDVPLGVFLSGGLDSSAIAAVMHRNMTDRLKTFSIGFPEGYYSELPYARMVAGHLGADHHEVILTARDFLGSLPRMVWHEDEPIWTIASVAMYHVSKLAAEHVKVVLTGEGSDELFAGYDRYWFGAINDRFASSYGRMPRVIRDAVRTGLQGSFVPERARRALSHTFLCREGTVEALVFDNWFGIFTPAMQRDLCSAEWLQHLAASDVYGDHLQPFGSAGAGGIVNRMLYTDIKTNLVELLMKQDRMSMATSIESRVPFLDHHVVEFAATIPEGAKIGRFSGKRLLKDAVRDLLPEAIINRRKQGFPVPFDTWLREDFFPEVRSLLLSDRALARGWFRPEQLATLVEDHRVGKGNYNRQIWALLNLELWARIFIDEEHSWVEAPSEAWTEVTSGREAVTA